MAPGEQALQGALADLKALSHDGSDELLCLGCKCGCCKARREANGGVCDCAGCRKSDASKLRKRHGK
jgi:hypothetical protein